jgi:putative copper export protein
LGELSLVIHVILAAVLVGPQVLMFYAVAPASWLIEDDDLRTSVVRVIARRFASLTVVALAGLLITGLWQFYTPSVVPPSIQDSMNDYRWGGIFMLKMTLFVILVGMIAFHGAVLARRIGAVTEEVKAGRAERWALERARRNSLVFSGLMVLVSIAILALGVLLAFAPFADQSL